MKKALKLVGLAAAVSVLMLGGCAASRISTAAQLARESEPFQTNPPNAALRLLLVGDSTGVGTGANVDVPVYARVPAGATNVPAGDYLDTVRATLTY